MIVFRVEESSRLAQTSALVYEPVIENAVALDLANLLLKVPLKARVAIANVHSDVVGRPRVVDFGAGDGALQKRRREVVALFAVTVLSRLVEGLELSFFEAALDSAKGLFIFLFVPVVPFLADAFLAVQVFPSRLFVSCAVPEAVEMLWVPDRARPAFALGGLVLLFVSEDSSLIAVDLALLLCLIPIELLLAVTVGGLPCRGEQGIFVLCTVNRNTLLLRIQAGDLLALAVSPFILASRHWVSAAVADACSITRVPDIGFHAYAAPFFVDFSSRKGHVRAGALALQSVEVPERQGLALAHEIPVGLPGRLGDAGAVDDALPLFNVPFELVFTVTSLSTFCGGTVGEKVHVAARPAL